MTQKALTRQTNIDKRNRRIKEAFEKRYTHLPRPRLYSREYIISQLADEYFLSMARIEDIIRIKVK